MQNAAVCDGLSLALVLVVCFVGSLIAIFALPYMKHHEEHLHLAVSKQPGFFLIMLAFLGFMNGLALANDIRVFEAFFEATTLCSFLLIGHDKTEIATKNALRALWMNCLGGIFLHAGILLTQQAHGLVDIHEIVNPAVWAGASMLPVALLLLAGCVKAAQMPFQSWLLGAMVAPTPVSALLHSSTMVKVGVFMCLRLAPVLPGTATGVVLATAGAFTFFAASALALGQSNAKKILAYSTVANLGLIIACAGMATPAAIAAGVVLLVIHAATKALLFLCVGDMEQIVGSRDLEDLRGAVAKAPTTALAAAAGALAMILPPLGMLMGKWAAIEAALTNPILLLLMALGSALAVVCWVRFAGTLLAGVQPFAGSFVAATNALALYSMIAFALSAVMSVPQVVKGLDGDVKKIRAAIAAGTAINLFLVLVITLTTLAGAGREISQNGALVDLAEHLGGWVGIIGYLFTLLALATSFWANTLNLRDIVREQTNWGVRPSWAAATLPSLLIALLGFTSFVGFTRLASLVQVLTGIGVIVAYARSRRRAGASPICGCFGTLPFRLLVLAGSVAATAGALLTID